MIAIRVIVLALICSAASLAQPAVEFEAASVKLQKFVTIDPSDPGTLLGSLPMMQGGPGTATPGRIRYSHVTLNGLILKAYDFQSDQVLGRPDWMNEERYAIDAVVPAGATKEQFRQMLQNLLTSRFKLTIRWEEKDFKVYRLVLANGGPKLKPSVVTGPDDDDYDLPTKQSMSMKGELDKDGCPVLSPTRRGSIGRNGCTTYVGYTVPELAFWLAMMVGNETGSNIGPNKSWAHIADATGLAGRFDFTLKYDNTYHTMLNMPGIPPNLLNSRNPVSIFKAVEAQLGLKLEPATSKLKVMVIQHAERTPTAN